MAKLNVTGMEQAIRSLEQMGESADQAAERMLAAGAEVVRWEWQKAIKQEDLIDTGAMFGSVRPTKIREKDGAKMADVYPQGTDENGTRNAEKAFVANYGRRHQQATHFAEHADEAAEAPAQTAMMAVWDGFIGENN